MKGGLKVFSLFPRRWLPVALWAGFVLYASTSIGSGNNTARFLRPILAWIHPDLALASLTEINFFTRKTAHVVQFVFFSMLLWRGLTLPPALAVRSRVIAGWILGTSAVLALLSEGIQLYSPLRTAQFADVWLDLAGAMIGVTIFLAVRGMMSRRGGRKKGSEVPEEKIFLTSDLHLDGPADQSRQLLEDLQSRFRSSQARTLVVAGDFGVAERAGEWMAGLREVAGPEAEIIISLGNHDHWLQDGPDGCKTAEDVREKYWRPACVMHRIHCLDFENVRLNGLTVCGGYAHYDFGFRDPGMEMGGRSPTLADYRTGRFDGLVYPDMERIPGLVQGEEADKQAKAISRRLSAACDEGKPVLFVTHTVPFSALSGHKSTRSASHKFFDAFSGNSAIGSLLAAMGSSVVLAVCGHTHQSTPLLRLHGIPCMNMGSGPGHLRCFLFNLKTRSLEECLGTAEKTTVA